MDHQPHSQPVQTPDSISPSPSVFPQTDFRRHVIKYMILTLLFLAASAWLFNYWQEVSFRFRLRHVNTTPLWRYIIAIIFLLAALFSARKAWVQFILQERKEGVYKRALLAAAVSVAVLFVALLIGRTIPAPWHSNTPPELIEQLRQE